ncbi:MAG: L,D-transpeptidase family protein [Aliishimia sp.]
MRRRQFFVGTAVAALLAGCSTRPSSKFKSYGGPRVTRVIVNKGDRKMFLMSGRRTLKAYEIELGFAPIGDKKFEGDGKTPEGEYLIDRRNPNSRFHLSLGINYPSAQDVAEARAIGKDPGGEIFIHGQQNPFKRGRGDDDWTWGCISVTNRQMEDIYAMVKNGTPITLNA